MYSYGIDDIKSMLDYLCGFSAKDSPVKKDKNKYVLPLDGAHSLNSVYQLINKDRTVYDWLQEACAELWLDIENSLKQDIPNKGFLSSKNAKNKKSCG